MAQELKRAVEQIRVVAATLECPARDGQLLARFLASQDQASFATLVGRHGPMVLSVCKRVLRNHHDAEDAFQATFMILARKGGAIRKCSVASWLHTVAYRSALAARSSAAGRQRVERQVEYMPEPEATATNGIDWKPALDLALRQLADKHRGPIVLCDLEGLSRRQASLQLNIPEGTLSSRLNRARSLLGGILRKQGVALATGILTPIWVESSCGALPRELVTRTSQASLQLATGQLAIHLTPGEKVMHEVLRVTFMEKLRNAVVAVGVFTLLCTTGIALELRAGPAHHESWIPAARGQVAPSSPSAVARLPNDWQIQLRAVDADGRPIAHPRFGVQLGASDAPVWHDGDPQGRYVATLPKREPGYCYLLVRAKGYAPVRAFWRDPLPTEFTFEMTKAITVGGSVMDELGKPISGATVFFSSGHHDALRRAESSFYREECTTDEHGRWKCDLAPVNISSASINVLHPDFANDPSSWEQDQRIPELLKLTHTWTLKKGFSVTGRVIDAEGKPIAGATLAMGELNWYADEGPFQHTDADGRYRFKRVAPHDNLAIDAPNAFTVSVVKPGFMPVMESVPGFGGRPLDGSTKDERVVDLTLKPGATLKLRVVDAQNKPIKGAWIIPDNWRGTTALRVLRRFGIPSEADEHGIWRWTDAPLDESIGFDVLKRGFSDVRDHKILVNDASVEKTIVLKQPQIVMGTVIDARTKQAIPEFIVERAFENVGGHPDGLYWATTNVTSGKNGAYLQQVTMPPHNGRYTYRARAAGYETSINKSIPFAEGEAIVNFELQRKSAEKPD